VSDLLHLSDLEWLSYTRDNDSPIGDYFTGQLIEVLRCIECRHVSVNMQPFRILPVPIPDVSHGSKLTLHQCLAKMRVTEHMSGNNGLACEHCSRVLRTAQVIGGTTPLNVFKTNVTAVSPSVINLMSPIPGTPPVSDIGRVGQFSTSTPVTNAMPSCSLIHTECSRVSVLRLMSNCLIVQLLRFHVDYSQRTTSKMLTQIEFPLVGLDLSALTLEHLVSEGPSGHPRGQTLCSTAVGTDCYELFAFCVHLGGRSISSGHYLVYARDGQTVGGEDHWWKLEDEKVETVPSIKYLLSTNEVQSNVYLLLYQKSLR